MSLSPIAWLRALPTSGPGVVAVLRRVRVRLLAVRRPVAVGSAGLAVLLAAAGTGVTTGGGDRAAVPLTPERATTLVAAARSCPTLTAARLAGQVMATSAFESDARTPRGGSGVAGLTDEEWRRWRPWPGADRDDPAANVHALARHMCDVVGQLRIAGVPGDLWAPAVAAFDVGVPAVRGHRGVPPEATGYVAAVSEFTAWCATRPELAAAADPAGRRTVLAAGSAPRRPEGPGGAPTGSPAGSPASPVPPTGSPAPEPSARADAPPPTDRETSAASSRPAAPAPPPAPPPAAPRTASRPGTPDPRPVAVALTPGRRVSLQVTTPGFTSRYLRHAGSLGYTEVVGPESDPALRVDATFTVRRGLANGDCLSFESVRFAGAYLRHFDFRLRWEPRDGSALFDNDATFCAEPGRAGTGVSLRAYNVPGGYVRHFNAAMWVARSGGPGEWDDPEDYQPDVTWLPVTPWAP